jgi:hypothetical protein
MDYTLSNGKEISFDEGDFDTLRDVIIKEILIPHYEENNDWPEAIQFAFQEAKQIFKAVNMDKEDAGQVILNAIEDATGKEIAELTGVVDTVEILFHDVDDVLDEIRHIIDHKYSEEKTRMDLAKVIEKLTRFEIVELILAFARRR